MFLGLLLAGMAAGALVAGLWLVAGGTLFSAILLYSVVGTAFVIGSAVLSFAIAERREKDAFGRQTGSSGALPSAGVVVGSAVSCDADLAA